LAGEVIVRWGRTSTCVVVAGALAANANISNSEIVAPATLIFLIGSSQLNITRHPGIAARRDPLANWLPTRRGMQTLVAEPTGSAAGRPRYLRCFAGLLSVSLKVAPVVWWPLAWVRLTVPLVVSLPWAFNSLLPVALRGAVVVAVWPEPIE